MCFAPGCLPRASITVVITLIITPLLCYKQVKKGLIITTCVINKQVKNGLIITTKAIVVDNLHIDEVHYPLLVQKQSDLDSIQTLVRLVDFHRHFVNAHPCDNSQTNTSSGTCVVPLGHACGS